MKPSYHIGRLYKEDDVDHRDTPYRGKGHHKFRVANSPEEAINLAIVYGMTIKQYVDACKDHIAKIENAQRLRDENPYRRSSLWRDDLIVFELACPQCRRTIKEASNHRLKEGLVSQVRECERCEYVGLFRLKKEFQ